MGVPTGPFIISSCHMDEEFGSASGRASDDEHTQSDQLTYVYGAPEVEFF